MHQYGDVPRERVEAAASPERVVEAVRAVAGEHLDIGPLAVGPGGAAQAKVDGILRSVTADRDDDTAGRISYAVLLDIAVDLDVIAVGQRSQYEVELLIPLRATVAEVTPAAVHVAATPPHARDIRAVVRPKGLQARLLAKVGNLDATIRHEAALYVRDRIDREDARSVMSLGLPNS